VFSAGLLARSQFASGRSCDRPTRSRFSVVFLDPRANAELAPKFQVALHASHAALPMVTSKKFFALTQPVELRFPFKFNLHANPPPHPITIKLNFHSTGECLHLPEGQTGNAWEPSKPMINSVLPPRPCSVTHYHPLLFIVSLLISHSRENLKPYTVIMFVYNLAQYQGILSFLNFRL
jgi:hypothetical protein